MNTPEQFAKNESEFINAYKDKGYTASYRIENGNLIALETKEKFSPKHVKVVAEHRYEGMSNPDDMSILYVLDTGELKGTFLMAYGPSANNEHAEFFNAIPESNISDRENILNN